MSGQSFLFLLVCTVAVLLAVICCQRIAFGRDVQDKLKKITERLSDILEKDTDEKVMVFTDNEALMNLSAQINRMLLDRQKVKSDYRRQELSAKKMLSNISHDIKTPLTVILGYLEILRLEQEGSDGQGGEQQAEKALQAKKLQKVEAKAEQVMELIDQFFTLAKLEAGDTDLEITKLNINELCRENVLGFYELLMTKEFTVDISIPEQKFFVRGDKKSIDRILNNLLSNAIRYGGDGKYAGLFVREEEGFISIDVVDKGKGIEREFAQSVFERLYTMEDSRNRQTQGNGLGLTIAKNLARQMGGDILLESEPGIKTVFTVRLKKF